ncbi:uncharacterized protein LOC130623623 [Hydractinia symbiolongicarpus]|uniref:uncharacterized protein LOC130623623 n=1 Tax=Hydractinia symbiolongicarpus TaxID=13093 RepID=UPI00254CF721|nr:uncharacterized protein LOC130623623 [Hydractinia symbiolongicarpus]
MSFTEGKRFIVAYRNMHKIVSVAASESLKTNISEVFSNCPAGMPDNFSLQFFDPEFEDYIELEDSVHHNVKKLGVIDCSEGKINNKASDVSMSEQSLEFTNIDDNVELPTTSTPSKSWPRPFVLKDVIIRPSILETLNGKNQINRAEMTVIHTSIFDERTKSTYHPTYWQYDGMLHALVFK